LPTLSSQSCDLMLFKHIFLRLLRTFLSCSVLLQATEWILLQKTIFPSYRMSAFLVIYIYNLQFLEPVTPQNLNLPWMQHDAICNFFRNSFLFCHSRVLLQAEPQLVFECKLPIWPTFHHIWHTTKLSSCWLKHMTTGLTPGRLAYMHTGTRFADIILTNFEYNNCAFITYLKACDVYCFVQLI